MNPKISKTRMLTLAALLAAIHCVILIFAEYVPGLEFLFLLFIPTLVAILSCYVDLKYLCLFIVITTLICFLFNPLTTLIYLLPSLVMGALYGVFSKTKLSLPTVIFILSFVQSFSLIAVNYLILYMLDIDIMGTFKTIFDPYYSVLEPILLFLLGLSQAIITHIITSEEYKRLSLPVNNNTPGFYYTLSVLIFPLFSVIFYFIFIPISILFTLITYISLIPIVPTLFKDRYKNPFIIIAQGVIFILIILVVEYVPIELIALLLLTIILPLYLTTLLKEYKKGK